MLHCADVLRPALADGAAVVGKVGAAKEELPLLGVQFVELAAVGGNFFSDPAYSSLNVTGVFALALGHPDLLGGAVSLLLELLVLGFKSTALFVHVEGFVDERGIPFAAGGDAVLHGFGIFAQESNIEHAGR